MRQGFLDRSLGAAKRYRAKLLERYGKDRGDKVQHVEAFELCEYGRQASQDELKQIFIR